MSVPCVCYTTPTLIQCHAHQLYAHLGKCYPGGSTEDMRHAVRHGGGGQYVAGKAEPPNLQHGFKVDVSVRVGEEWERVVHHVAGE